jgi:hypothetical protein
VVFYNGEEKRPEKEVLRLSDAFTNRTDAPELELVCTVYNINKNCNENLKRNCKILDEYMAFVDKVRESLKKEMPLEEAIADAIDTCIENHILEDFLRERRMEVQKVMTLDYTWERREELIRKEVREEGREEVRQIIKNMLKKNFSLETISECTSQPMDYIRQIAQEQGATEVFVHEENRYGK